MHTEIERRAGGRTTGFVLLAVAMVTAGSLPGTATASPDEEPLDIDVAALFQVHGALTESGSPDGNNWAGDSFVRRARILVSGRVTETLKFFFGTLHGNFGKAGDYSASVTTADAFLEYDAGPELKVDVGLLMIPFLHNMRQSGASILTIDWHLGTRKYPVTAHSRGRDFGVGARGVVSDSTLSYHLHMTRGTWTGDGVPRFTGRLAYNLFDAETGYFLAGTYLGKKKIVSFGAAFDMQPKNGGLDSDGELTSYYALGGDVFVDYPLGVNGITAQINGAYYKNSIANAPGARCAATDLTTCSSFSGVSVLSELGYRWKHVGPVVGLDWTRPDGSDSFTDHSMRLLLGANYWLRGHTANLKLQYSLDKQAGGGFGDGVSQVLVQGQAFIK